MSSYKSEGKVNNLAEDCLVGLGIVGNYVTCLVISMELAGAEVWGGGFKVDILRRVRERGKPQRGEQFLRGR